MDVNAKLMRDFWQKPWFDMSMLTGWGVPQLPQQELPWQELPMGWEMGDNVSWLVDSIKPMIQEFTDSEMLKFIHAVTMFKEVESNMPVL